MPGILTHSPAQVLAHLLRWLELGTDPALKAAWPVRAINEAATPDNVITCYNTAGRTGGRTSPDRERQEYHGVQVRVRSGLHEAGFVKARAIAVALDQDVYQEVIIVAGTSYLVQSVIRTGDINIFEESPTSKRSVFTVNALMMVRQV